MIEVFSVLLCIVAFSMFAYGQASVARQQKFPWLLPTVLLVMAAPLFRWVFGWGFGAMSFWETLAGMLRDVAVGLLVSALVALLKKGSVKLFLVPGILLIVAYIIVTLAGKTIDFAKSKLSGAGTGAQTEWLVELGPDDDVSEIAPILERHGAVAVRAFANVDLTEDEDLAQFFVVTVRESAAETMKKELLADVENVDYLEANAAMGLFEPIASGRTRSWTSAAIEPNDPRAHEQWALKASGESDAFARLNGAKPKKRAKVAILDTGVDAAHEDLAGVFGKSPGDSDRHGHGTHCAGIAGAATHNGKGVASLNWGGKFIEIRGYSALDNNGGGSLETIAQAIIDAAEDKADVLSLSLGGFSPNPPRVLVKAVEYARKLNAIVVVAAGNSNDDASRYSPANVPGVITVAASDPEDQKAEFSNVTSNLKMAVTAPGVDILSLKTGGDYVSYSGTSMATPMVAGVLGVMRALNPDIDARAGYNILRSTGRAPVGTALIGPIVNADAAIAAVAKNR